MDEYLAIGQRAGASDIHLGINAPPIWRLAPVLTAKDTTVSNRIYGEVVLVIAGATR